MEMDEDERRRRHSWKNRLTVAEWKGDLIAELRGMDCSWDTIAKLVGCSRKTAWTAMRKMGVQDEKKVYKMRRSVQDE